MRIHRKNLFLLASLVLAACSTTEDASQSGLGPGPDDGSWSAHTADSQEPSLDSHSSDNSDNQLGRSSGDLFGPGQEEYDTPQEAREVIEARQAKRRLLAQNFVERADLAFERSDYQQAAVLYAEAFQLDPSSRAARDGMRRTEAALGGEAWDYSSSYDQLEQQQIRWARERMRVEGLIADGDRQMANGNFGEAVNLYRSAEIALEFQPNLADSALDRDLVGAKLNSAMEAQQNHEEAVRHQERAAAEAAAQAEQEAEAQYFDNRLRTMFATADMYFQDGFYDKSVNVLDAILELDPRNEDALNLREVANDAYFQQRQRRADKRFREEWRTTFQELRSLAVPPQSALEYDAKHWREVATQRVPLDQVSSDEVEDPTKAAIEASLDSTRIEPRFDNLIEEIAENLSAFTRVNFVVSRTVREDVDDEDKTIRMSFQEPMSVARILNIIEDQTGGTIQFVIRNGVVNVISAEEATGGQQLRNYQVRDIVRKVQDFVSTEINLSPSGGIDEVEEELPEKEATILTEEELLEAIQENIEPDAWDDTAFMQIEGGTLTVNAVPSIHEEISKLLNDLRKASNIMVEIKVRFLKVEDSFLQDVGIDFRGLGDDATSGLPGKGADNVFDDFGSDPGSPGSPGTLGTGNDSGLFFREANDNLNLIARTENLYDSGLGSEDGLMGSGGLSLQYTYINDAQVELVLRAVEKSERSEVVTEPKLMVYNTSRANLTVANQVSYVSDFDVEIAQAAAIADPIVRVAKDGIFMDVRPVVTADRRFVYIDVRPTVATLRRPIPTFQTSLGTGSPVTLQLPELEIQKIRTRVLVPDGATILLGGLKVVEEQEIDSGIPFLKEIPVLSFFFSRKGSFESYRKLIILLTSRVIIPTEHEPSAIPGSVQ